MDVQLIPDVYVPSVDTNGNYIDKIPIMKEGLFCQCGARKDNCMKRLLNLAPTLQQKHIKRG